MVGPAVALSPPPPPKIAGPAPLLPAPDALKGISIAPLRMSEVPTGTRTDLTRAFNCGASYRLYPEVKRQSDGTDRVVYWTAVDVKQRRADFLVGPDALAVFTSRPSDFAEVALRYFAQGSPDAVTTESAKVVDVAMRDGFGAAFRQLARAWTFAAKTELHVLYEEWRAASTPLARKQALAKQMNEQYR
ncbi:MAG: hypothetical protein KF819_32490 [Labilithrix sp.]|nr:hypothetical protein [Labilithrix sp.]